MYYVYILLDDNKDTYIGYTKRLNGRVEEHLRKNAYYSSRLKNSRLYYYEAYESQAMAQEREKKLKQYGSSYHGLLKRIGLKK